MDNQPSSLAPGALFANRYQVVKLLGQGGMGNVYLVRDKALDGDLVALKLLHFHLCRNEKLTKRFTREVQCTRKITHPNVVRTFDIGFESKRLYYTMEYAEGKALKDLIEEGPIEPDIAVGILEDIAQGLGSIHAAGVIHRDLKSGNVILTPNGVAKITDFSIAHNVSELTDRHELLGSTHYMAPEVWKGGDLTPATDIYALGVLAYEILTGVRPFEAETTAEFMFKHLESQPVPVSQLVPEVPPWLDRLVLDLLAKLPQKRPVDTAAVIDRIRAGLDGNEWSQTHESFLMATEEEEDNSLPFRRSDVPHIAEVRVSRPGGGQDYFVEQNRMENHISLERLAERHAALEDERGSPMMGMVLGIILVPLFAFLLINLGGLLENFWLMAFNPAGFSRVKAVPAVVILASLIAGLASLPHLFPALACRPLLSGLSSWAIGSLMMLIPFIILLGGYHGWVSIAWMGTGGAGQMELFAIALRSTLQATSQSFLEMVMLMPNATWFTLINNGGVWEFFETHSPFLLLKVFYFIGVLATLSVFSFNLTLIHSRPLIRYFAFSYILPLGGALVLLQQFLHSMLGDPLSGTVHLELATMRFSFSHYNIVCGLINWILVVIVAIVLVPARAVDAD